MSFHVDSPCLTKTTVRVSYLASALACSDAVTCPKQASGSCGFFHFLSWQREEVRHPEHSEPNPGGGREGRLSRRQPTTTRTTALARDSGPSDRSPISSSMGRPILPRRSPGCGHGLLRGFGGGGGVGGGGGLGGEFGRSHPSPVTDVRCPVRSVCV